MARTRHYRISGTNADFPFIVSDYHLSIMPVVGGQLDVGSGIGTGGYILEKHEPGVRAKFKRNLVLEGKCCSFDEVEIFHWLTWRLAVQL